MLKYRFIPYIGGVCVVVLFGIAYLSDVNYKADQSFKAFMVDAQAFNRSADNRHEHSSHEHTHHGEVASVASDSEKTGTGEQTDSGEEHPDFVGRPPDGEYSYNIAGRRYVSNKPMTQKAIEVQEWLLTGKMTPAVEEAILDAKRKRDIIFQNEMIQRVVTPDGQLRQVIVPPWAQYEEGDAILQSELDPPRLANFGQKPWLRSKLVIDGVEYYPPKEYYSIADPYDSAAYFKKFSWSIKYDISMAEVEKRIASGELPQLLSESEKKAVDEEQIFFERARLIVPNVLPRSDKMPVKVSFLPADGDDAPGWMRKWDD